jgi:hypothetical protein
VEQGENTMQLCRIPGTTAVVKIRSPLFSGLLEGQLYRFDDLPISRMFPKKTNKAGGWAGGKIFPKKRGKIILKVTRRARSGLLCDNVSYE